MPDETPLPAASEIDVEQVDSAVLRRLIEEVRQDLAAAATGRPQAYDRVHNRHNRGNGGRPWPPPRPTPPPPEPPEEERRA